MFSQKHHKMTNRRENVSHHLCIFNFVLILFPTLKIIFFNLSVSVIWIKRRKMKFCLAINERVEEMRKEKRKKMWWFHDLLQGISQSKEKYQSGERNEKNWEKFPVNFWDNNIDRSLHNFLNDFIFDNKILCLDIF